MVTFYITRSDLSKGSKYNTTNDEMYLDFTIFFTNVLFSVPKSNPGFYTALLSMSISFGLSAAFQSPEQSCRFGGKRPYAKVSFHGFPSRIHGGPMALLVVSTSTTWSGMCGQGSPLQTAVSLSRFLFGRKSVSLVHCTQGEGD